MGEYETFRDLRLLMHSTNLHPIFVILYFLLKVCAYFIAYYNVAKYVFFEFFPRHSKKWNIYFISILLVTVFLYLVFYEIGLILLAVGLIIPLFANRKTKKWVILLEAIPWIAIAEIFVDPFLDIIFHFVENKDIALIVCISFLGFLVLLLIGFITIGKKWRLKFDSVISKLQLANWERVMLCVVGILLSGYPILFGNYFSMFDSSEFDELLSPIIFVSFAVVCIALAMISIIIITMTNKKAAYQNKVLSMQSNVISMMAEIIENRDENTGGHIQRTAKYVEIIARELQEEGLYKNVLTNEYIEDMKVAAPLHDIGKIHVSDLILNKPGRLEPEEFEIMKTHAEEGRKLLLDAKQYLGDFNYLDIAVDMAGSHHEWWDGNPRGYPDHKKGEEIPLCARIMAVADVFDALTSKRCYRDAMQLDKAYKIIREERGTHFDKTVVDAFFAANTKIEEALNGFLQE